MNVDLPTPFPPTSPSFSPRANVYVETVENHFVAETLADVRGLENLRAYVTRLCAQLHVLFSEVHARTFLKVVETVDAELCFACARLRLTAHPFLLSRRRVFRTLASSAPMASMRSARRRR